ncbi:hypothetical protein [Macrococcus capreoli]|uniref:hypothetical protein n=1 Tax=Macrococcus capreoli TaxID=2982690 RepID=UPI0021D58CBB|nr:hypothetical protein [Macrococcus sp. TMW 2.2395]MCU7556524.1 hypothetical protein [Macrococcus sp. TMW 2.2395]
MIKLNLGNKVLIDMPYAEMKSLVGTMFFASMLLGRAILFFTASDKMIADSPWYQCLNGIAELQYWGIAPLIAAITLFVSMFSKSFAGQVGFTAGNLLAFSVYVVLSATGADQGLNWYTAFTNIVFANYHMIMAALGVYRVWTIKSANT